jgi:signal peptidase I
MFRKALYIFSGLAFIICAFIFYKPISTSNSLVYEGTNKGELYLVKKFKNGSNLFNAMLPSQQKLERGDVIVFYDPTTSDSELKKKKKFVGRLIGLPGDAVTISDKNLIVNNEAVNEWYHLYFRYRVTFSDNKSKDLINTFKNNKNILFWEEIVADKAYEFIATPETSRELSNYDGIVNIRMITLQAFEYVMDYFPKVPNVLWNKDHYGPVYVPQKDVTLALTIKNIGVYKRIIDVFEDHKIINDLTKIEIDGEIVDRYTFEKDYYFVLNDNRDSGIDSRHYGFIPADHIIGKAVKN